MQVLGIESSCDETAAAIVTEHGLVLSSVIQSQDASHAPYGGVVPEIAARDHMRAIGPVIERALQEANVQLADLDGIAVTSQPGLLGALLVGVQAAKGLAWAADLPLVGIDHLLGHLLSVFLRISKDEPRCPPCFPFLGLLVSGGHTALYHCKAWGIDAIEEIGATRDDAVGEAFDKVAKLLDLGYPGGPIIDRLAATGDAKHARVVLPTPMDRSDSPEFSFSGLKSAVARHVASADGPITEQDKADLCAAFQSVVTKTLVKKTVRAAKHLQLKTLVVAGGVAANRQLRSELKLACHEHKLTLFVPTLGHCTDNAAMIAFAGTLKLNAGERDTWSLSPSPRTALPRVTRKGRGRRRVQI